MSSPMKKLSSLKRDSMKTKEVFDYVPHKNRLRKSEPDLAQSSTLPYSSPLPDIFPTTSRGVDNLTYKNDSSDSDR